MSSVLPERIRLDDEEIARLIQDGSTRWKMLALAVSVAHGTRRIWHADDLAAD